MVVCIVPEMEFARISSKISNELISGILKIEITGIIKNIPIRQKDEWIPRKAEGVYIFTTIMGDKYVGSSEISMFYRINQHIKNFDIDFVDIYLTNYSRVVEKWFMREIKPELNNRYSYYGWFKKSNVNCGEI